MNRPFARQRFASRAVSLSLAVLMVVGCAPAVERTPDAHPTQAMALSEATNTVDVALYLVDQHIASARAIVEGTVSEMLPQRLATGSHVLPTPFTPQPNMINEEVRGSHNQIYQPMILSVDEVLKGDIDGKTSIALVAYIGLAKDASFPHDPYRHVDIDKIAVGTKAIVFISSAGLVSNIIMDQVRADAFEREALNLPTYAARLHYFYRFEGTDAVSDTGGVRMPITELREHILESTIWGMVQIGRKRA